MTDRYGYDPYGQQQPQILGYDEYGRPVYQQAPPPPPDPGQQQQPQEPQQGYGYAPYEAQDGYARYDPYDAYDPYAAHTGQQPPVQDAYAGRTGQQPPVQDPYAGQNGYQDGPLPPQQGGPGQDYGHDPYGQASDTGAQQPVQDPYGPPAGGGGRVVPAQAPPPRAEQRGEEGGGAEYRTEQFSFVEEPTDDSEDVIDWLKFTESRTERREEAKRRGRSRKKAMIVLVVLAMLGGAGYLWYAEKLPGVGGATGSDAPVAGEKRDVLVVHLRPTEGGASSTALLVDNSTTGQGTTLLLPNSLAVSTSDGATTTLGKSVEDEGATPTRDALDRLLGAEIKGSWRLDTPYLEILVDSVGGIVLPTDAEVPGKKKNDKPLVKRGKAQDLDGRAAVAYATHRASAEPKAKQLARFGQVMQAVLKKISSDRTAATSTVESLGQILDPSLSQESLGATLAQLAERARSGDYTTRPLPVQEDGTLSRTTSDGLVKDVLGGTVKNSDPDAAPRVSVRNASGDGGADDAARVALVNGGYTVVGGGTEDAARAESQVLYADAAQKAKAEQIAKTLGLPGGAVTKGKAAGNADVTVVLGQDYEG